MTYVHCRDLDVFRLAYRCALELHRVTLAFPKYEQYGGIADQMRRASKGICANLMEGLGKNSSELEERRFLSIALGSAEEVGLWLQFAGDLKYLSTNETMALADHYQHISRMLNKLMQRRQATLVKKLEKAS